MEVVAPGYGLLVHVWLEDSQLTLNLKKADCIIFKSHKRKYKKELKITLLIRINMTYRNKKGINTSFLGVMIYENLTWKNHINYLTCKIAKTAGILCKARHFIKND